MLEIVEDPLSRPKAIPRKKGTMIDCVHDLLVRTSKNLSPEESAKVKELLDKHNETTFHDREKPDEWQLVIPREICTEILSLLLDSKTAGQPG